MASYSSQDFFVLSTKDKIWLVTMGGKEVSIYEFKNPQLDRFTINFPRHDSLPVLSMGAKNYSHYVDLAPSLAEAEFSIKCLPKDLKMIHGSRKDIQPDEFYSLKELQKISKMMTRKLEKAMERK